MQNTQRHTHIHTAQRTNNNHKERGRPSHCKWNCFRIWFFLYAILHRSSQDTHIFSSSVDSIVCCCFDNIRWALQSNFLKLFSITNEIIQLDSYDWLINFETFSNWSFPLNLLSLEINWFHFHVSIPVTSSARLLPKHTAYIYYKENMCALSRIRDSSIEITCMAFFHMIRCHAIYSCGAVLCSNVCYVAHTLSVNASKANPKQLINLTIKIGF